jgi:hypothetical protein
VSLEPELSGTWTTEPHSLLNLERGEWPWNLNSVELEPLSPRAHSNLERGEWPWNLDSVELEPLSPLKLGGHSNLGGAGLP